MDLGDTSLYLNRELSWLRFNQRVLQEARTPENPLLERVKFLGIVANNLDEFFEVRIAGLLQQVEAVISDYGPDGLLPEEQISAIAKEKPTTTSSRKKQNDTQPFSTTTATQNSTRF